MRLLHTSDWHLGHTLKDASREAEHAAFLAWLLETCSQQAVDVVVITGDVFDSATPPASAERMWFDWLAAARRRAPAMDIVAIAGNHDSPARFEAAAELLRELRVHVIGRVPRQPDGAIDHDRLLIPVAGGRALVAAVPFLRAVDVDVTAPGDPIGEIYRAVLAEARRRRAPGQALIALGHLYMTGAEPSAVSERRIAIGGVESCSPHLFDGDLSYVALGHLHRAQAVGRATVRYAGAPIPLALDEAAYRHQVVVVDSATSEIRTLPVPRTVEIVRIAGALDAVLAAIAALPDARPDDATRPYLDVQVALTSPQPRLRTAIDRALDGKRPRLVQLRGVATGNGAALAERVCVPRLAELDPTEVFVQLWARDHAQPPSADVRGAFDRLLADVRGAA